MAALSSINHRRNRRQTRRVLADLRIRYSDLARSSDFQEGDLGPIGDQQHQLQFFAELASRRNRR